MKENTPRRREGISVGQRPYCGRHEKEGIPGHVKKT